MGSDLEKNLVRVFVAFPITSVQADKIISIRQQNFSIEKIRWTPLMNLHMTLFFVGEVPKNSIKQLATGISQVIQNTSSFNIEFEKVSIEGKPRRGGMVWIRFFKNELFTALNKNIYEAAKEYVQDLPVLKDPIPHVTIARFKNDTEIDQLNLSFDNQFSLPEINFCELWQTIQSKEGVSYKNLERFYFSES